MKTPTYTHAQPHGRLTSIASVRAFDTGAVVRGRTRAAQPYQGSSTMNVHHNTPLQSSPLARGISPGDTRSQQESYYHALPWQIIAANSPALAPGQGKATIRYNLMPNALNTKPSYIASADLVTMTQGLRHRVQRMAEKKTAKTRAAANVAMSRGTARGRGRGRGRGTTRESGTARGKARGKARGTARGKAREQAGGQARGAGKASATHKSRLSQLADDMKRRLRSVTSERENINVAQSGSRALPQQQNAKILVAAVDRQISAFRKAARSWDFGSRTKSNVYRDLGDQMQHDWHAFQEHSQQQKKAIEAKSQKTQKSLGMRLTELLLNKRTLLLTIAGQGVAIAALRRKGTKTHDYPLPSPYTDVAAEFTARRMHTESGEKLVASTQQIMHVSAENQRLIGSIKTLDAKIEAQRNEIQEHDTKATANIEENDRRHINNVLKIQKSHEGHVRELERRMQRAVKEATDKTSVCEERVRNLESSSFSEKQRANELNASQWMATDTQAKITADLDRTLINLRLKEEEIHAQNLELKRRETRINQDINKAREAHAENVDIKKLFSEQKIIFERSKAQNVLLANDIRKHQIELSAVHAHKVALETKLDRQEQHVSNLDGEVLKHARAVDSTTISLEQARRLQEASTAEVAQLQHLLGICISEKTAQDQAVIKSNDEFDDARRNDERQIGILTDKVLRTEIAHHGLMANYEAELQKLHDELARTKAEITELEDGQAVQAEDLVLAIHTASKVALKHNDLIKRHLTTDTHKDSLIKSAQEMQVSLAGDIKILRQKLQVEQEQHKQDLDQQRVELAKTMAVKFADSVAEHSQLLNTELASEKKRNDAIQTLLKQELLKYESDLTSNKLTSDAAYNKLQQTLTSANESVQTTKSMNLKLNTDRTQEHVLLQKSEASVLRLKNIITTLGEKARQVDDVRATEKSRQATNVQLHRAEVEEMSEKLATATTHNLASSKEHDDNLARLKRANKQKTTLLEHTANENKLEIERLGSLLRSQDRAAASPGSGLYGPTRSRPSAYFDDFMFPSLRQAASADQDEQSEGSTYMIPSKLDLRTGATATTATAAIDATTATAVTATPPTVTDRVEFSDTDDDIPMPDQLQQQSKRPGGTEESRAIKKRRTGKNVNADAPAESKVFTVVHTLPATVQMHSHTYTRGRVHSRPATYSNIGQPKMQGLRAYQKQSFNR